LNRLGVGPFLPTYDTYAVPDYMHLKSFKYVHYGVFLYVIKSINYI